MSPFPYFQIYMYIIVTVTFQSCILFQSCYAMLRQSPQLYNQNELPSIKQGINLWI